MNQFWIVGKSLGETDRWEFQGLFDDRELAKSACVGDNYFIAPVSLNEAIGDETSDWPGLTYKGRDGWEVK